MAEPQTMSKADVLDKLAFEAKFARSHGSELTAAGLEAIAAAVAGACWRQEGHEPKQHGERACRHCGQRRADGTEGGR